MIADTENTCSKIRAVKKFITPDLRLLRALFFFFLLVASSYGKAQKSTLDILIHLVETYPHNDSAKIRMMHSISRILVESDVSKSFAYYEQVSHLSDSLHFTYGKALANINLGILLSSAGNFESGSKAYFIAYDQARACGAPRLQSVALNNIGDNFSSLRDFDKSSKYVLQALE